MRIIDTHTHLPGRLIGAEPRPVADVRKEFEAAGVVQAWFFTTDGLILDPTRHNTLLAEAVKNDLDLFTPFCTVNPHEGEEAAIRELERATSRLGMKGLKLHPWLQAFSLTNPNLPAILHRAGELSIPVVFHDGSPPYSAPLQIGYAAELAPKTTIILGHAGLEDLVEDAIRTCVRYPNVWLCICGPSCGFIEEIVRRCPTDRLLFGSDGGFSTGVVEWCIAKLREAVASDSLMEKITWENPRRIIPCPVSS